MYPQQGAPMAPPQKPETFMLSNEAQQSLPQDAQVALQQVDNRKYLFTLSIRHPCDAKMLTLENSQIFPDLRSCGLDSRFLDQKIPSTDWRICILCPMVSGPQN
jgi:hypothetical protein